MGEPFFLSFIPSFPPHTIERFLHAISSALCLIAFPFFSYCCYCQPIDAVMQDVQTRRRTSAPKNVCSSISPLPSLSPADHSPLILPITIPSHFFILPQPSTHHTPFPRILSVMPFNRPSILPFTNTSSLCLRTSFVKIAVLSFCLISPRSFLPDRRSIGGSASPSPRLPPLPLLPPYRSSSASRRLVVSPSRFRSFVLCFSSFTIR